MSEIVEPRQEASACRNLAEQTLDLDRRRAYRQMAEQRDELAEAQETRAAGHAQSPRATDAPSDLPPAAGPNSGS